MPINTGTGDGSWNDPHTGTGGDKNNFFHALRRNMEKKGWKTVFVPDFDWAAIETAHYDMNMIVAAFDADAKIMLEGAHLKLSHWADDQQMKIPETRIAIAVFNYIDKDKAEYITRELQKGSRMGKQSMTAVIDLSTGQMYEPQEGSGPGYKIIRFNKPVMQQLKEVVNILAAGY